MRLPTLVVVAAYFSIAFALPFLTTYPGEEVRPIIMFVAAISFISGALLCGKYRRAENQLFRILFVLSPILIAILLLASQSTLGPPTDGNYNNTLGIETLISSIVHHTVYLPRNTWVVSISFLCIPLSLLFATLHIAWLVKKHN